MNNFNIINNNLQFECGCIFAINNNEIEFNPDLHDSNHTINFKCPATYKLLQDGLTEGVFQLNSDDGKTQCRKLLPTEMEHISAIGAIIRPGCKECLSGDTNIAICLNNRKRRKFHYRTLRELYEKFQRNAPNYKKIIVSCNEHNLEAFENKINSIMYKGVQDVYRLDIRIRKRVSKNNSLYKIESTLNHRFLTKCRGWKTLAELKEGERILVANSLKDSPKRDLKCFNREKSFRDVCFANYEYKCVFCDWNEGELDVNHIDGNRKTNNHPDNLCFLCPNHHRVFSEGNITKENIISEREKYKLENSKFFMWAVYNGKTLIGSKDTYDIDVEGPNNNFIAGNVVAHNSKDKDGLNITTRYQRKKNGKMELTSYHPIVDKILEKTYGENIYQESSLELAKQCAGFTLVEADLLRKGIGKKIPEIIAQCKKDFLRKGEEFGIFTEEQLVEIFGWIEASQRYSFNHSHSWAYGLVGYITAYIKAHFPIQFYKNWLIKEKKREKYINFINEAKLFNIAVYPPDLRKFKADFYWDKNNIYFGLHNIKGIVKKDLDYLSEIFAEKGLTFSELGKSIQWLDFLAFGLDNVSSKTAEGLIHSGALDCFEKDRAALAYEYERWSRLTATEKRPLIEFPETYKHLSLEEYIRLLVVDREGIYKDQIGEYNSKVEKRKTSGRTYKTTLAKPGENRRLLKLREILTELTSPLYNICDTNDSLIFAEENLLGVALTRHKTDEIPNAAETATCLEILKGKKGYNVLRVKVDEIRPWKTKNDTMMAFIKLSDRSGVLPAIAFGEAYDEYQHLLVRGNLVFVSGEMGQKDSFIIKRAYNVG